MLSHASGMVYEGLFINGRPSRVACQLKIKCESPLEVIQGMPFALDVECIDEDGEVVEGICDHFLSAEAFEPVLG